MPFAFFRSEASLTSTSSFRGRMENKTVGWGRYSPVFTVAARMLMVDSLQNCWVCAYIHSSWAVDPPPSVCRMLIMFFNALLIVVSVEENPTVWFVKVVNALKNRVNDTEGSITYWQLTSCVGTCCILSGLSVQIRLAQKPPTLKLVKRPSINAFPRMAAYLITLSNTC